MRLQITNYKLQAQGLLELIVALGVITTGVIGTVTLTTSSLASSTDTMNRVTATYLASEGIEAVRLTRDSNWLSGCPDPETAATCVNWDTGLAAPFGVTTAIPEFDPRTYAWNIYFNSFVLGDAETQLYADRNSPGLWYQNRRPAGSRNTALFFWRLLKFNNICADGTVQDDACADTNEKIGLAVESTVRWQEQGRDQSVSVAERLYNWR